MGYHLTSTYREIKQKGIESEILRESNRIKWIPNPGASYLLPEGNNHTTYFDTLEYQNDYIMSQEVIEICLTYSMDKRL